MELAYLIIAAIVGITLGFLIGALHGKGKNSKLSTQIELLQYQLQTLKDDYEKQLQYAKERYETDINAVNEDYERDINAQHDLYDRQMKESDKLHQQTMQEQERRHKEAIEALQRRFDETILRMTEQVKNAANDMLRERQKEFAESSNANIGAIVTPLRETIDKMKKAMDDNTIKQTAMTAEMRTNIENMMRQSESAKQSADELARVFKQRTKVQGDWGETVLDELLASQGLTKGIHYDTQAVIRDQYGNVVKTEDSSKNMRPDVILHLDQQRDVIIDAKVSLSNYIDYVNADNETDKQRFLRLHIDSVNRHVKELSTKNYAAYIQPPKVKMDYVIMFVPHSGALWTALNAQPDLWRKAMEQNVFIADEQTLFAALRIINHTWTQIKQAQQHEQVYRLAEEMLDRVGQFIKHYEAVGKALENAQKSFDNAKAKLEPHGQSILTTANKLIQLGAKPSAKNPLPPAQ
ncbi:MAG: DNA recombination protein RmuC [Bacteroidaceae bacterium]|nr:DNA recombination protein RmuC [Bacteroidaceae bacterium]